MRKWFLMLIALAATTLVGAGPAWGHVTVSPDEAAKGATATFTFSVPNEEPDHATVSLEIVFPDGVTFSRVAPEPKPGWTATPGESSVQWSGGTITGENKEAFSLTLGPLPNAETLVFKALQRYDDGTVVRWIEEQQGDGEPERPAPVVRLTGDPVAVATTTPMTSPTPSVAQPPVKEENGVNRTPILFGALVLTGVGVGIAIAARRRSGPQP